MMSKIFVSYVVQMKTGNFYGDCVMDIAGKPQSADDVDLMRGEIERDLKEKDFEFIGVFIQNWIVMAQ